MEDEIRGEAHILRKHYINAGSETVALYTEKSDGTRQTSYLHHDHLGSLDTVTNETGQIIERLAYNAWGKRRQPNGAPDPQNLLRGLTTTRGFTHHEHLDSVGLIHMNGRVYDPALGRFLSPDPHIQAPANLQSYNRYSYVMNNPLSYTDPSGYFSLRRLFSSKVVRAVVAIAAAVYTGGAAASAWLGSSGAAAFSVATASTLSATIPAGIIGGAAGGFTAGFIASGGHLESALKAGVTGGISGGIFGGVNASFGDTWNLQRVAANSLAGGVSSELSGGRFVDGFKTKFITSSSAWLYTSTVGQAADPRPGKGLANADGTYTPLPDGRVPDPTRTVIGLNDPNNPAVFTGNAWTDFWANLNKQGGFPGTVINYIPGINATAVLHDTWWNPVNGQPGSMFGFGFNPITNWGTMLPAAAVTYGGLLDNTYTTPVIIDRIRK